MDPWSGEIVALANVPDYDVATYQKFPADARRDRAVTDSYEPGSTFKLITAAAALDSKKVTTYDRFPTRDRIEIGMAAADCLARAIARAVYEAEPLPFPGALPSWRGKFEGR